MLLKQFVLFISVELRFPIYQCVVGEPERVMRLVGVDISLKRAGNAPKLIPESDVGSTHRLQKRLDLIRSTPFGSSNIVVISRTMSTARMHPLATENGSFLSAQDPRHVKRESIRLQ